MTTYVEMTRTYGFACVGSTLSPDETALTLPSWYLVLRVDARHATELVIYQHLDGCETRHPGLDRWRCFLFFCCFWIGPRGTLWT